MPVEERKSMVDAQDCVSVSRQCQLIELNRSTYYYQRQKASEVDLAAMIELDKLYMDDPTRGTRRMSHELKKLNFSIGRHHTRTLMQIMRLKTVYCRPRTTVINSGDYKFPYLLRNLDIKRANQVWAIDITYVPMYRGYMFLFAIIDVYSRYVVGWSLSNTMETGWIIQTLRKAVKENGIPEIINSDQGSQFTSREYVEYIKSLKTCQISMDGKGRALDNVYIERFFRTIKYEKLYLLQLEDGQQVMRTCDEFIQYYNCRRDHSSIQNLTPEIVYKSAA